MGGQCLLVLIGLKVLVMINSLQNIVISGAQGLLMLMGSKFLIKMTRPQNTEASAAHLISHLFQQGLFSSWPPFFTPGVFLIRFQFYKGQYCAQYHDNSIVDFHVVMDTVLPLTVNM